MPRGKKQKVEPQRGGSTKGALVLGISWGIAIVSMIAFGGLLFYVLTNKDSADNDDTLGAKTNINANQEAEEDIQEPEEQEQPQPKADITKLSPISDDDYILGDEDAAVTLIEFSDFQCPFCLQHQSTLKQILDEYEGKVRLVYRHFPLTTIHPDSQKSAEAAECAGEQGKFWEMHDMLFENQKELSVENLKEYAKELDLDTDEFDECLDSGKYISKIQQQTKEAIAAGITGTPGTFVNNDLVKGAIPFEQFKLVLDQVIAASN